MFNGSDSYDPDALGGIDTYYWDFGDVSNGTGKLINHTYTTASLMK